MSTQIASLYADIGADTRKFKAGMADVDRSLTSSGKELTGFSGMVGKAFPLALGAATAGLTALGVAVYSFTGRAADMQQSIANIAADMSLTKEETSQVAELISDLGLDPKLKVTATEAAEAIHMLGKNGQDLTDIFGGTARATVLLANSTGGDFGTAADLATDVMAQFKIEAKDMMDAVNGITGTTQFSKFGIEDYRLAIAQAGGVAASVGVSFDDFNATIAAISPLFASGSDAGTSFKTFLQRLIPQSKEAGDLMKELGIITADGTNRFFDASGQLKSMSEIAGILNTAFAGLSEEQKINAASTIFGTDAMRTAFGIADAGSGTIDKLKQKIGNVDAEKSAETRMGTLKGSYEIFTGVLETLAIKIGDRFIPHVKSMIDWLTKLATDKGPLVIDFVEKMMQKWDQVFPRVEQLTRELWGEVSTLGGTVGREIPLIIGHFNNLFNAITGGNGGMGNWIVQFLRTTSSAIGTVLTQIRLLLDALSLMGEATNALLSGDFGAYFGMRERWNNIWGEFGSATSNQWQQFQQLLPGFAGGGRMVSDGVALVGERGPELVDLPGGSYVHNNVESMGMMGGSSSRLDIYVHANGTMPTDRNAIRELAIALQRELNLTGARVVMP